MHVLLCMRQILMGARRARCVCRWDIGVLMLMVVVFRLFFFVMLKLRESLSK
jgi:hypothetical protein